MATNSKWKIIEEVEPKYYDWIKNSRVKVECECWKVAVRFKKDIISWKSLSCWHWNYNWSNNPNWKWWINDFWNTIRKSKEYKDWRTKCFQRDLYTCQISGQKWWDLVVHHLSPFSIIISDLDIETYRDCELLWDINNWITITRELHNEFHNIYWKKLFTKENFLEFNKIKNAD